MFSLLDILLLVVPVLLVIYVISFYTYWKRRNVLQVTPLPLFGNYGDIGRSKHIRDINLRLYNEFKGKAPIGGVYIFIKKAVMIVDLDLVKQILVKDFTHFTDRGVFNNVRDDPLTGHLVTLEGDEWRAMRHKLTPVFTAAKMKYMFPTVVKVGENFAKIIAPTKGVVADFKDLCARYTTDVIGNCVFGIESNSLKNPHEEFRKMGNSVFIDKRHHAVIENFILTNPGISRRLGLKMFKDELTKYFLDIIQQTVDHRSKNNLKRNDFMDLLIELKAQDEVKAKADGSIDVNQGLSLEQMAAQAFSFFVAGFETSSTTMSFCLYELARHPNIQDKLRAEIHKTLKDTNEILTYEGINSMDYLDQVISETLRLYSPLPQLLRVVSKDYQIPNTSYVLEKGISVVIPNDAIHYDPEFYENPSEFKPERFHPSECDKRHPCAYLPFGDGPRNCIGLRFGKMQMKVGLASLLRYYRFECCPLTEIPIQIDNSSFFLSSKNGIMLKIVEL